MLTLVATLLLTQAPETAAAVLPAAPTAEEQKAIAEAGLSDAAVAKLTPDQLHDVLRHRGQDGQQAIAVVSVIGFYIAAVLIIAAVVAGVLRAARLRAETLRLMVEKGAQIPPELIAPRPRPQSDLRRGLILSAFGLGLGVFLLSVEGLRPLWALGLVPLFVGVGYLVSSRLIKPDSSAASAAVTAG